MARNEARASAHKHLLEATASLKPLVDAKRRVQGEYQ